MSFIFALLAACAALRLRRTDSADFDVIHVDWTTRNVDYNQLMANPKHYEATKASIADFISLSACGHAPSSEALLQMAEANCTDSSLGNSTDLNCPNVTVSIGGDASGLRVFAELDYSPTVEAGLTTKDFPEAVSNFFLVVPSVILASSNAPIVDRVLVERTNITSFIPGCQSHLKGLLTEMHKAYTWEMVSFALTAECSNYMSQLTFSSTTNAHDEDKEFCQKAGKDLMEDHFDGDTKYSKWCINVCQQRFGPFKRCDEPVIGGANATNATIAASTTNGTNGTNATNATM